MKMEVESRAPAVALELSAARAAGSPDLVRLTLADLDRAEVGTAWAALGGGHLFQAAHTAIVVWRDDKSVVLLVQEDYSDDSRVEHSEKLVSFSLTGSPPPGPAREDGRYENY